MAMIVDRVVARGQLLASAPTRDCILVFMLGQKVMPSALEDEASIARYRGLRRGGKSVL